MSTEHTYYKCTSPEAKERGVLFHNCKLDLFALDLFHLSEDYNPSQDKVIKINNNETIYCINICDSCVTEIQKIGFDLGIIFNQGFWQPGNEGAWIKIIESDKLLLYKIL